MSERGKGHKTSGKEVVEAKARDAFFWEIFLLDMGILIRGVCMLWNEGLEGGFLTCLIGLGIMSVGYACLSACLAELTSITNFAGGVYGYSRCSLGPKYGWYLACLEILQYNLFTVATVDRIAQALRIGFDTPVSLEPLWMLVTYAALLSIHMFGGGYFWYSTCLFASLAVAIVLLYLLSTMSEDNFIFSVPFGEHEDSGMRNGGDGFMQFFMYAAWFYLGIECVTVAGSKIGNGTQMIPKVMMVAMVTMVALSVWMLCVVFFGFNYNDHPIAILYKHTFPMSVGFSDYLGVSEQGSALLMIPALFASASGFLFCAKHICHALAMSGLYNPWFKAQYGVNKIPRRALVVMTAVQIAIYLLFHYIDQFDQNLLFVFVIIAACGSYFGVFTAYLTFYSRFPTMERGMAIPQGRFVAYTGMAVFGFLLVSAIFFHANAYIPVILVAVYMAACAVYYYKVAEKRQFFSHEEQKKFMKAYILNANKMKKKNAQRAQKNIFFRYMNAMYSMLPTTITDLLNSSLHGINSSHMNSSNHSSNSRNQNSSSHQPAGSIVANNKVAPMKDASTRAAASTRTEQDEWREDTIEDKNDKLVVSVPVHPLASSHPIKPSSVASLPKLANSGSAEVKVVWSGRMMNPRQSREFYEALVREDVLGHGAEGNVHHHQGSGVLVGVAVQGEQSGRQVIVEEQGNEEEVTRVYHNLQQALPRFFTVVQAGEAAGASPV